jgi:hypothetical protein
MDLETIRKIDDKWNSFGLQSFIESPSLHYSKLIKVEGPRAFKS